jgi:Ni,Fe-hydrogenase I large subunit
MAKTNKKIKKTIWLTPQTLGLVKGYSEAVEEDFSNSVETLILKGLENIQTANDLKKIVYDELLKVKNDIKKSTDRLANLAVANARFSGRIYAHTFKTVEQVKGYEQSYIHELETMAIPKAIQELRKKNEVDHEEA